MAWILKVRRRTAAAVAVLAVNGGVAISTLVLKEVIGRDRPVLVTHAVHAAEHGLPSAHTAQAAAFYGLCGLFVARRRWGRRTRTILLGALGLVVGLVGLSRIYLEFHWLSDVAAGYAVAAVWLAATSLVLGRRSRRDPSALSRSWRPDGRER
jgi:undecaprenyl-diphosphatase